MYARLLIVAADALEEVGSNDYDAMLLDLGLPDGDGFRGSADGSENKIENGGNCA
jgi:DNA-binding response OmpR family regulator